MEKDKKPPLCKGRGTVCGGGIEIDRKHNKKLVPIAKTLRKNMTKEERHLWYDFLRTYSIKFLRQKPIGRYVVDFYSVEANLVIELDGSQHYDERNVEKDIERTKYLEEYGLTVLRIPNNQINQNFRGVCEYIDNIVNMSINKKDIK